jgi:hypothetical protein
MSARTMLKDGACVFLGEDRLCAVHKEIGPSAKPIGCTQFPFIMRPTPDGVFVGVSFYCSAVQANHGRPLAEHEGELQRILAMHHFPGIGKEVALAPGRSIDWALYRTIEADLHRALQEEPLAEGAWRGAMRVLLLAAAARRGVDDLASAWPRLVAPLRDEVFESLERMFLTGIVGAIESSDGAGCKANTEAIFRRRALVTESFGAVDLAAFDDFRTRFDATWSHHELRRYLDHLLFRKFLAYKRTLSANTAAWSIMLPLLEWYRDLSAYAAGRLAPDLRDVHRAFDIVERSFATHTQTCEVFYHELAHGYSRLLDLTPTVEGAP